MAIIIDGKAIAAAYRARLAEAVKKSGLTPGLAVVLVGDDPASHVYVRNKVTACEKTGIRSFEYRLPVETTEAALLPLLRGLNEDPNVHGILVQLPLPPQLDARKITLAIDPAKDVDGLHPANAGRLMMGIDSLIPCTPQGSLLLIQSVTKELAGKHAVVIGRSLLFGKPMGQLLLNHDCTVTQAHSKTRDLPSICRQADILVAAVGRPNMVTADWVKEGAIVIDVGINRLDNGKLTGDVDFESVKNVASAITPVPGGVGPMTITCLLANTLKAAGIVVSA
jgi:methylenetetrahydrofolate dehydrogenase (NADP+) / methenyltetrahydrofolate cyclohydrolase